MIPRDEPVARSDRTSTKPTQTRNKPCSTKPSHWYLHWQPLLGFTQSATAAGASAAPATVIVYRADESVKTRRLRLDISADNHNLGTLRADNVVVAEGAAGQYTLGTSMAAPSLTLDLKPGATYCIHADLKCAAAGSTYH